MSNKQKGINKFIQIFVVAVLLVTTFCMIAYSVYIQDFKENEIARFDDGDKYTLVVVEVGKTSLAEEASNCRFKLEKDGEVVNSYNFTISNNREDINEDNFEVDWGSGNIRIIVSAKNQNDLIYFLNYK